MIFIYDIVLNWSNKRRYEFFEWNEDDEIEYIKKIPLFRINNFDKILDNNICIDNFFLKNIYSKTEIYGSHKVEKVNYACLFCNSNLNQVIAVEFDRDGTSLYKSNVYILDLDDIFSLAKGVKTINLKYQILDNYKDEDCYLTRSEINKKQFLIKEINETYQDNNIDKLKYIYYEIFGNEIDDSSKMREEILASLNNNFVCQHNNIYNFIRTPDYYKNI